MERVRNHVGLLPGGFYGNPFALLMAWSRMMGFIGVSVPPVASSSSSLRFYIFRHSFGTCADTLMMINSTNKSILN